MLGVLLIQSTEQSSAIDKVIEQAGISISMAVMTQVGLLNAALGILAAIGVVVAAMLGLF